nr:hypothetical protein [Streptomyces triticiradicis]
MRDGPQVVGQLPRGVVQGRGIGVHVIDQADTAGAIGVDGAAGERQFVQVSLIDQQGESLETAEVGDDPQFGFGKGETGLPGGVADVAGADQFQGGSGALAVDEGDDRLGTVGDGGHHSLEEAHVIVHEGGVPRALGPAQSYDVPAQVHSDGERSALAGERDGADVVAGTGLLHEVPQAVPEGTPPEGPSRPSARARPASTGSASSSGPAAAADRQVRVL